MTPSIPLIISWLIIIGLMMYCVHLRDQNSVNQLLDTVKRRRFKRQVEDDMTFMLASFFDYVRQFMRATRGIELPDLVQTWKQKDFDQFVLSSGSQFPEPNIFDMNYVTEINTKYSDDAIDQEEDC